MSKNFKYPSLYELEQVLGIIADRSFLNDFAQNRGIFITNANKEELARELSNLNYEESDLEAIRNEAYNISSNNTLSGFQIKSTENQFNLKNIYEWIRENSKFGIEQKLSQLVTVPSTELPTFKGSISYTKKKVGRMEFLQSEESTFEFFLIEKGEGLWQVEIDSTRSTDSKELKKLFEDNTLKSTTTFEQIEHALLGTDQTISFFDNLATTGLNADWRFVDVKHLTLKKGKNEERDISQDQSEEIVEEIVEEAELVGITQAILQGENLRENSFVKNSVRSNYQFTAMTYEFEHLKEPLIIEVKAEFKGRPKVFEVAITKKEERLGLGGLKQEAALPINRNRAIRSEFWNNAKKVFEELVMGVTG